MNIEYPTKPEIIEMKSEFRIIIEKNYAFYHELHEAFGKITNSTNGSMQARSLQALTEVEACIATKLQLLQLLEDGDVFYQMISEQIRVAKAFYAEKYLKFIEAKPYKQSQD